MFNLYIRFSDINDIKNLDSNFVFETVFAHKFVYNPC